MRKRKVVVLGGGVGAMCAAYQLTLFPNWQDRFDITVYQMGWRLGGKGASGRNALQGQRIEEHGLHVWAGFYDNAIRLMRTCYEQAQQLPDPGVFGSFDEAFQPFNNVVLTEYVKDKWIPWNLHIPPNSETAGEGGLLLTPWDYLKMMLELFPQLFEGEPEASGLFKEELSAWLKDHLATHAPKAGRADNNLHKLHHLAQSIPDHAPHHEPAHHKALLELHGHLRKAIHQRMVQEDIDLKDGIRRLLSIMDIGLAAMHGMIKDGVLLHGFDVIDNHEISEWLVKNGAHPKTIDFCLVRGIYDYAFGFRNGFSNQRAIAAGTSLRGVFRMMFTYKQSFFFKMQAGMGDTVFTPFYKVLKQAGVKFNFFNKVTAIKADESGTRISRISMQRQANLTGSEYNPLVRVKSLDCWPSEPDYSQLKEGEQIKDKGINLESAWADWNGVEDYDLVLDKDFDDVILGISVGGLKDLCTDLAQKDPRWQGMLDNILTTRTLACQLWLKPSTEQLGWMFGESILTCYEDNYNTWADMTHLLDVENWPAQDTPQSIAYFCGPMQDIDGNPPFSDHRFPQREYDRIRDEAKNWVTKNIAWLWPTMVKNGVVDWDQLVSTTGDTGEALFRQQYFRANIDPSERYVLCVPGSTQYRMRSDQSGFDNLYLAGDWTYNGINAGCVEAAAMSGIRAAAGLAGESVEIVGETDFPGHMPKNPRPGMLQSLCAPTLPWPGAMLYGELQTSGGNAMLPFDAEWVRKLLPPELTLAEQTLAPVGKHPVIFFFGWQDKVRPNIMPASTGVSYMEFILSVPYVRFVDEARQAEAPGHYIYMPHLYLDKLFPVLLGVYGYGYNKARAMVVADDHEYTVRDRHKGTPYLSAAFRDHGLTGSLMDLPNLRKLAAAYELPLLSKAKWGSWIVSYFDFGLGQARIQPVALNLKIYDSEAIGLPAGSHDISGADKAENGGFFFTTAATISNPFQSRSLIKRIKARELLPITPILPFPVKK